MLSGYASGRKRIGIAEELSGRGRESAQRVPLGNRPQPPWQRLRGNERIGQKRQREYDRERDLLCDLDGPQREAEPDADPRHRKCEQQE